jgi:hypothetical protein
MKIKVDKQITVESTSTFTDDQYLSAFQVHISHRCSYIFKSALSALKIMHIAIESANLPCENTAIILKS